MVTVLSWARGTKNTDPKKALLFNDAYPDANLRTGAGLPPGTCTPCPSGRTHFLNIAVTTKVGYREKVGTLSYRQCTECQSGRGNVWYGTRFPYARADQLAAVVESWVANKSHEKDLQKAHEKELKAAMKASEREFRASQREEMKAIKDAEKARQKAEKADVTTKKSAASGRSKGKMREVQSCECFVMETQSSPLRFNSAPVVPSTPIPKSRAPPKSAPPTIPRSSTVAATDLDTELDSDSDLPELADTLLPYRKRTSTQTAPVASTSSVRLPVLADGNKKRTRETEGSSSSLGSPAKRPRVCLEFDSDEEVVEYELPDDMGDEPPALPQSGDQDRDGMFFSVLRM
ncbi:hypothetical protein PQX77_015976 [Marasmius sp. AFHP31]|nr:hypothetical protein PQX77_015976 [Marasmius sp. AFHP31]